MHNNSNNINTRSIPREEDILSTIKDIYYGKQKQDGGQSL